MRRSLYMLVGLSAFAMTYQNAQAAEAYSQISTRPRIAYDKEHVEPYMDFTGYKNITFTPIGEQKTASLVTLYNPTGWAGEERGDFRKIKIELKNKQVFEFDNLASWDKLVEPWHGYSHNVRLSGSSGKIQQNPYFTTISMSDEEEILVFLGCPDASIPAYLTLIYVTPESAEVVFNKSMDLEEIVETERGFRLIGNTHGGDIHDAHEIVIEDQALKLRLLPVEKVYEAADVPVVLYNSVGWGHNKQAGDFTKVVLKRNPAKKYANEYGFYRKLDTNIDLPTSSTRIKRCPHFITLDAENNSYILVLRACRYEGTPYPGISLLYVSDRYIRPISTSAVNFYVDKIEEVPNGYRIIGRSRSATGEETYCEEVLELGRKY